MALPPVLDHPVFTSALQESSTGVCVITRSGHTILWANEAFMRACGSDEAPVQGALLRDRWSAYHEATALFASPGHLPKRATELAARQADGSTSWWDAELVPLGPEAMMLQLIDCTARVRGRQELESLRNATDRLLSMFNHDLRNPLTPAGLTVAMLLDDERIPEGVRGQVATIRKYLQQHSAVLDELVTAGRMAMGRLKPSTTEADARAVLHRVLRACRPELDAAGAVVEFEPLAGPMMAIADPDRLEQALKHVIRFALRTLVPGKPLRLQSVADDAGVEMTFAWTAEQIDKQRIASMLEAAGLPDRLPSSDQLGLAVARGLLELQGSTISAMDAGSEVGIAVRLPAAEAARASMPSLELPTITTRRSGSLKILLVDDDATIRRMLTRLLQRDGHDAVAVETVAEAIREASSRRFDVLISDMGLPDGSGTGLLRQLRCIQSVVGIALTGHTTPEHRRAALTAGFAAHLAKPVDVAELRELLAGIAARAAVRESVHSE